MKRAAQVLQSSGLAKINILAQELAKPVDYQAAHVVSKTGEQMKGLLSARAGAPHPEATALNIS